MEPTTSSIDARGNIKGDETIEQLIAHKISYEGSERPKRVHAPPQQHLLYDDYSSESLSVEETDADDKEFYEKAFFKGPSAIPSGKRREKKSKVSPPQYAINVEISAVSANDELKFTIKTQKFCCTITKSDTLELAAQLTENDDGSAAIKALALLSLLFEPVIQPKLHELSTSSSKLNSYAGNFSVLDVRL